MTDSPLFSADDIEVPIGWRIHKVSDVGETYSGGTPSRDKPEYFKGTIPWIKSGDLNDGHILNCEERITDLGLENSSTKMCRPGTVLIAMYGATTGRVSHLKFEAAINQAVCAIVPGDQADSDFLMYALMFRRNALLGARYGGAQPNISQQVIRSFQIALPPLAEQRAIAEVLQAAQESNVSLNQELIAAQGLFRSLLKKYFEEDACKWPMRLIPEVCNVMTSTSSELVASQFHGSGKLPLLYLKVSDMNLTGNEDTIFTSQLSFSVDEVALEKIKYVPPGSIILPKRGAAIATNKKRAAAHPSLLDPNLLALSPTETLLSNFLFFWMTKFDLRTITDDGTLPQLNKKNFDTVQIPVPPMPIQEEVASNLSSIVVLINSLRMRQTANEQLFASLLHHLMTGQIRIPEFATKEQGGSP